VSELAFGQPFGIVQFAYFVEDTERAIGEWVERLGVGPWIVREKFRPPTGRYRGEATDAIFTIAHSFAGHTMVELVEQHNDAPSVFNELGLNYGFHHWGLMTKQFDADVARYQAMGYEEAYFDTLPTGSRVMYLDARRDLPGMVELLEHSDAQEQIYTEYYEATVGWDGRDPIRRD
jgi:hypothetical protein